MNVSAKDWACSKCTALNDQTSPVCWNCKTPLANQKFDGAEEGSAVLAALDAQQKIQLQKDQLNAARSTGRASIADVLRAYLGRQVGINVRNPAEIEAAILVDVQGDFFTVQVDELVYHMPYASVLRVVAGGESAVSVGALLKNNYSLVITVFDLVIYKGSIGVGLSVPL